MTFLRFVLKVLHSALSVLMVLLICGGMIVTLPEELINNHENNITQEPRLCRQVRVQNLTKNQTLTQKVVPLYKTGTSGSMNLNIKKIVLLLKT